ncbi:hypothetical protein FRC06_006335 [Ceratobasidium sp. 370]|nr:hypothetical protein FRC06_006335 [Ceratobasidium sp. 370]
MWNFGIRPVKRQQALLRHEDDISTNRVNFNLDDKAFRPSLSLSSHKLENFHNFDHNPTVYQDNDALESGSDHDPQSDFNPSSIDDLFARSLEDTDAAGGEALASDKDGSVFDDDDWETESDHDPCETPWQYQSAAHYAPYSPTSDSEWKPFPGKAFARQTQGETIPTYYALRKFQKSLKLRVGDPSKRYVSPFGTVYYVNKISEGLKQDMSNPHVRPHMNFYPHVDGKRMSQAWHGHKMVHDIPDRFLTPCMRYSNKMFYIGELALTMSLMRLGI